MAHIALGVTGSVAAIKTPALVRALQSDGHEVRVVATGHSLYFFDPEDLPEVGDAGPPLGSAALFRDADEWPRRSEGADPWDGYHPGDPVLHIELRRWADVLLVAPIDANSLAKFAYGLSDNLLTCLYRCWDPARPVVLAPAMNTFMWESPLTLRHLQLLLATWSDTPPSPRCSTLADALAAIQQHCPRLQIVPPQSKRLACGDVGMGAMADVLNIVATVRDVLHSQI